MYGRGELLNNSIKNCCDLATPANCRDILIFFFNFSHQQNRARTGAATAAGQSKKCKTNNRHAEAKLMHLYRNINFMLNVEKNLHQCTTMGNGKKQEVIQKI